MRAVPSLAPVITLVPSGLNLTEVATEGCGSVAMMSRLARSNSRTPLLASELAIARVAPSGENATALIQLAAPSMGGPSGIGLLGSAVDQRCTLKSAPPAARVA